MTRKNATYLLIAYFFFIALVLLMPLGWMGSSLSRIASVSWSDKLVHALLFLPLAPLWKCAFPHHALGKILLIALLIAITVEGTHYLLPYRAFEVNDLLANFGGIFLGTLFCAVFFKRKR